MYSNILVPLDGSDLAEKALPYAVDLAKLDGATVHLVYVFTSHPEGVVPVSGLSQDLSMAQTNEWSRQIQEANISRVQGYLDHTSSNLQKDGIETQTALLEGSPHEELVKYAKQNNVDIVTICSHGRGGLKRMLIGSVTDKIIRSGETPVLVIPGS